MIEKNPKTINVHLNRKYGKQGTKSRSPFTQKSPASMIAELVRDARKKAKLTQED